MTAPMPSGCEVSWLRMEMYLLGDGGEAERDMVATRLQDCAHCRQMAAEIREDTRSLPMLPEVPEPWWRRLDLRWMVAPPVLVAALALFFVGPPTDFPPAEVAVKGGNLAVETVTAADGRVQVRVTCPPGIEDLGIVVFEGRKVFRPLEMPTCGNRVVAGAMTVDEPDDTMVCVAEGAAAVARPAQLGPMAACTPLR